MALTLLAAGSPDPRHERDVRLLAGRLKVAGHPTTIAFLDHNHPDPQRAALGRGQAPTGPTTAVPLVIGASWRMRADLTSAVATLSAGAADGSVAAAEPVGVHPLLLAAAGELIGQAGSIGSGMQGGGRLREGTGLILVTAGLRDPRTRRALDAVVASHGPLLAHAHALSAVRIAHLDAGRPIWPVRTLLRRLDACTSFAVLPLVLTDGPVRDRIVQAAHRVDIPVVPGTMAATRGLADLVLARARAARYARDTQPAPARTEQARVGSPVS